MGMMAGLLLAMASMVAPGAASFDLRMTQAGETPPAGYLDDALPVRFTDGMRRPRRSRYLLPRVGSIEEDAAPVRLRIRGRKVKLRVPIGAGS